MHPADSVSTVLAPRRETAAAADAVAAATDAVAAACAAGTSVGVLAWAAAALLTIKIALSNEELHV